MSFNIMIETDRSQVDGIIKHLENKIEPAGLSTFLQTVVDPFIRNRIDQRFSSEGDDVSGKWHPLAQATQMIRASYGFPPDHPINKRTGKLHAQLVGHNSDVKPNGFGATLTHPAPGVLDPLTTKKLTTAQSGSSRPNTQPRPVIGVNENDLLFVTSSLTAYLIQGLTP
jgi:hypothetical protein